MPTNTPTQTPTPTPTCPIPQNYNFAVSTGATIVPGTVDVGNHCDDCGTAITLPFPYTLYNQTFTTATVGSNGFVAFGTASSIFAITCMPETTTTYSIGPYWTDQCTGACGPTTCAGCGIFTPTSGTAPNSMINAGEFY